MATLPEQTPAPDQPLPDKVYFRIGEVAELLGVEPHVIRFWQQQFPAVRPERSAAGRFLYPRVAVERLQRIRKLLYEEGYTIAGAKKALQGLPAGPSVAAGALPSRTAPEALPAPVRRTDGRKVAELEAEIERLQREVRALQARIQAAETSDASHAAAIAGVQARFQAEVDAAVAELDELIAVIG